MTKPFIVLNAGLCILLFITMPARAEIVAENLNGGLGVTLPHYVGQSFTTGPAAQYSHISFNFYNDIPGNPVLATQAYANVDQTYFLLSSEYLGRNDGLSAGLSAYTASTTGVSGNQWVFHPSVTLTGNTQYWLYGSINDSVPIAQTFTVGGGDPYSGGQRYHSGGGPGNVFSVQTGTDLAFTINSTPVSITGDLDGDGFVGITDLNIVLGAWNQSVPPANPLADPSGDGFIGIEDLNVVLGNWNAGTPPTNTSNIPEPASVAMIAIGAPLLLRRRRS